MLPVSLGDLTHTAGGGARGSLVEYAERMLHFRQMDFEYALWLMVNLCTSPRTACRTALYHSRTKHHWARDDPAFVVLLLYLLLIATSAWCVAFAGHSPLEALTLYAYVVAVDFVLLSMVLSTVGWWFSNTYLHECASGAEWSSTPLERKVCPKHQQCVAFPFSWPSGHVAACAKR